MFSKLQNTKCLLCRSRHLCYLSCQAERKRKNPPMRTTKTFLFFNVSLETTLKISPKGYYNELNLGYLCVYTNLLSELLLHVAKYQRWRFFSNKHHIQQRQCSHKARVVVSYFYAKQRQRIGVIQTQRVYEWDVLQASR